MTKRMNVRCLRSLLAVAALALLAACAQPARVSQMTAPNVLTPVVAANPDMMASLTVSNMAGGKTTSPLWTSQVDNPEFKEALERSLEFNGLLAAEPAKARYNVSVNLIELSQPLVGFDLTVTSRVRYTVTEKNASAGATPLLDEDVLTPFTADFSSSLVAVERLRLANEGSIRENIKRFLTRLGEAWSAKSGKVPVPVAQPAAPAGQPAKPTS